MTKSLWKSSHNPSFGLLIGDEEIDAVAAAMLRDEIYGTFGTSIRQFELGFAKYCGCKYGVAVNSGTSVLQLAVAAADIGAGDELLISTSTNIATALAAVQNGAIPVPVDALEIGSACGASQF